MTENIANQANVPASAGADDHLQPSDENALEQATEFAQSPEIVRIKNETARLIGILSKNSAQAPLIIAPFGSRIVNKEWLGNYYYEDWRDQKLVSIEESAGEKENYTYYGAAGLLMIAVVIFLVISIPLNLIFKSISWNVIGIVTLIAVVLIVFFFYLAGKSSQSKKEGQKIGGNFTEWLKLIPGILLVLASGIALPFGAVYFFGDGKQLLEAAPQLASLGRLVQVSFITIASMLPALFFYLFGRQQVEVQKNNFYKEVMSLDPNVHSISETTTKYESLVDSVYGSGDSPFAILLFVISTALLATGWIITMGTLDTPALGAKSLVDFFIPTRNAFAFGFLGAYFFTLNMVFRRYVRADLTPKTYAHITVRLLITIVLVWVVSSLPQFASGSIFESGLFAVAFIIGVIPETGLTLIQDYVKKLINLGSKDQDVLTLTDLEGINLYDRARLLEEGIENIENLAHHNMIELIARTRLPTPRLVDMFDQAILYLHLGLEEDANKAFLAMLKSHGIRTGTDLEVALYGSAYNNLKNINNPALPLDKLEVIFQALKDDEWYEHIVEWRLSNSKQKQFITDPYDFYIPAPPASVAEQPVPAPVPAAEGA